MSLVLRHIKVFYSKTNWKFLGRNDRNCLQGNPNKIQFKTCVDFCNFLAWICADISPFIYADATTSASHIKTFSHLVVALFFFGNFHFSSSSAARVLKWLDHQKHAALHWAALVASDAERVSSSHKLQNEEEGSQISIFNCFSLRHQWHVVV